MAFCSNTALGYISRTSKQYFRVALEYRLAAVCLIRLVRLVRLTNAFSAPALALIVRVHTISSPHEVELIPTSVVARAWRTLRISDPIAATLVLSIAAKWTIFGTRVVQVTWLLWTSSFDGVTLVATVLDKDILAPADVSESIRTPCVVWTRWTLHGPSSFPAPAIALESAVYCKIYYFLPADPGFAGNQER